MEVEWRTDRPPKAGYYLITWRDLSSRMGGRLHVSEAWYNREAIVPWWWTRRYTGERTTGIDLAIQYEVLAWMPLPDPYVEMGEN